MASFVYAQPSRFCEGKYGVYYVDAVFGPRLIADARVAKYLQMRWNGQRVTAVAEITRIASYP